MFLVAQIGIQPRNLIRRNVAALGFAVRERNLDSLAQSARPSAEAEARLQGGRELGGILVAVM
jgi:hypothetical protein